MATICLRCLRREVEVIEDDEGFKQEMPCCEVCADRLADIYRIQKEFSDFHDKLKGRNEHD